MGKRGPQKGVTYKPTRDKALAREALRAIVMKHMEAMTDAQIKHAQGIKYLVKRAKAGGKFEKVSADELDSVLEGQDEGRLILEVWEKEPSVPAYSDLMNRHVDRAAEQTQTIDLTIHAGSLETKVAKARDRAKANRAKA